MPCPPPGRSGGDDNGQGGGGGLQGSAAAPARARNGAMGGQRGRTPDPGSPVLPSRCYRPRDSMYNAVLKTCRVKWGTSSATRRLTGQQQGKIMVPGA